MEARIKLQDFHIFVLYSYGIFLNVTFAISATPVSIMSPINKAGRRGASESYFVTFKPQNSTEQIA